jgi:PAS domain-containing protein
MKQDRRTKKQLIDELEALRRRLKDVEDSEKRHRQAERDLGENEQRLQAILQGSPISAFVIGKDHRILYWNRALEEILATAEKAGLQAKELAHWLITFAKGGYPLRRPCRPPRAYRKTDSRIEIRHPIYLLPESLRYHRS